MVRMATRHNLILLPCIGLSLLCTSTPLGCTSVAHIDTDRILSWLARAERAAVPRDTGAASLVSESQQTFLSPNSPKNMPFFKRFKDIQGGSERAYWLHESVQSGHMGCVRGSDGHMGRVRGVRGGIRAV
jgi:hypothetical protein